MSKKEKEKSKKNLINNEQKSRHFLSDIINSKENKKFINNNQKALLCFEDFIKYQKNKSRNDKLFLRLLSLNTNPNFEEYKKNPILILKSYDKNIFDDKKNNFKNQILGVDKGLITLPKNDNEDYISNYRGIETCRFKNNLNLKTVEKEENNNILHKNSSNNLIYSAKSLSAVKRNKANKITDIDRGKELITRKRKYIKINNENNFLLKMKKLKEDFENQLKYN